MRDLIFTAVTIAFFLISIAYVKFCDRIRWWNGMNAESIIMLLVSSGLMVYLLYALLRSERF